MSIEDKLMELTEFNSTELEFKTTQINNSINRKLNRLYQLVHSVELEELFVYILSHYTFETLSIVDTLYKVPIDEMFRSLQIDYIQSLLISKNDRVKQH